MTLEQQERKRASRRASYQRCKNIVRTEEWKMRRLVTGRASYHRNKHKRGIGDRVVLPPGEAALRRKKRRAAHYQKNREHELATNRAYNVRHPLHGLWSGMIERCCNPSYPAYRLYGGRGIAVCARWRNSFQAFVADMGQRPSSKHSIDRYPNRDGNYEPGNCRWATQKSRRLIAPRLIL